MADTKISALSDITALAAGDKIPVADASDLSETKSATMTEVNTYLQTLPLASAQITALGASTTLASTSLLPNDEGGTAKKMTLAQLTTYLQTVGMPRVKKLTGQHSISSTTATKLTDLDMTLEAGTYTFDYRLIVTSHTTTVGVMVGLNFSTGTAAVANWIGYWADDTAAITAEVHRMSEEGVKTWGFISGLASKTYTTTAPLLGTTVGVKTTDTNTPMFVSGVLVVTVQGNLEMWHSSETATATTVEAGSSLVVVRTA